MKTFPRYFCWRIGKLNSIFKCVLTGIKKIPMTYVLENKSRVTFLVIGDSLVLWKINTYKKIILPTRSVQEPVGAH